MNAAIGLRALVGSAPIACAVAKGIRLIIGSPPRCGKFREMLPPIGARNPALADLHHRTSSPFRPPCRDPGDNRFLALALVSEADAVGSSDEDLWVPNPWNAIPTITRAEFFGYCEAVG